LSGWRIWSDRNSLGRQLIEERHLDQLVKVGVPVIAV
jgi:hypothetical protein